MRLENLYAVAEYTFGSFRQFVTDPVTLDEALDYVVKTPTRPQDSLLVFELVEYE